MIEQTVTLPNARVAKITLDDVRGAAALQGLDVLEAITQMQGVAAKIGDETTLDQLCTIKAEILRADLE